MPHGEDQRFDGVVVKHRQCPLPSDVHYFFEFLVKHVSNTQLAAKSLPFIFGYDELKLLIERLHPATMQMLHGLPQSTSVEFWHS